MHRSNKLEKSGEVKERLRAEVKTLVGKGYRDAVKKWAGSLGVKCESSRDFWEQVGRKKREEGKRRKRGRDASNFWNDVGCLSVSLTAFSPSTNVKPRYSKYT